MYYEIQVKETKRANNQVLSQSDIRIGKEENQKDLKHTWLSLYDKFAKQGFQTDLVGDRYIYLNRVNYDERGWFKDMDFVYINIGLNFED